jgi:Ca2+-binding RTX toxin-like protein
MRQRSNVVRRDLPSATPRNERLFGQAGNDVIEGGAGRDFLAGGAGGDMIIDTQGPTHVNTGSATATTPDYVYVRDGQGDDVVRCLSAHSTVVADRGLQRLPARAARRGSPCAQRQAVRRAGKSYDTMSDRHPDSFGAPDTLEVGGRAVEVAFTPSCQLLEQK